MLEKDDRDRNQEPELDGVRHQEPLAESGHLTAASDSVPTGQGAPASDAAAEPNPAMALPEIPGPVPSAPPVPLYDPPRAEPRKGGASGWKLVAAALALVVTSAAVGSASTWYLMKRDVENTKPIGYDLLMSPSMQPIAQTAPEVAASVIPSIYKRVAPSVVAINVSSGQGWFRSQGAGSGFVVDPRGYILTNYHVIDGADRIQVKFVDGTILPATVVGTYRMRDLAVLKVDPGQRPLIAATLGDSDKVEVGELAIAIGNPFGNEFTVTAGIISALNREITEANNPVSIPGAIQTDAAINPGNSGGPLLNGRGEVIGINTAIESTVRGNIGLGFAVPINMAKEILPKIIAGEKLQRPFLGVELQDMTPEAARYLGTKVTSGAVVMRVVPDSPAEEAGLKPPTFNRWNEVESADVIIKANDTEIRNASDLINFIARQKIGDTITLTVVRGQEERTVKVTLGATDVTE